MNNLLLVGVTQRVDLVETHDELRDALDQRLIDWLVKAGCVPIPIPNTLVDLDLNDQPLLKNWLKAMNISALILSGGNDIGQQPYRDLTELFLLSWAEKNSLPVLGLCRGMQMMGVWGGARLVNTNGHVKSRHKLQVAEGSGEWSVTVNSFHNMVLDMCPEHFRVLATSEEGNLEAMEHQTLPWEAWMWHPEREETFSFSDIKRFRRLLKNE